MTNWTPSKLKTLALQETLEEKTDYRLGENICKSKIQQVALSRIYEEFSKLSSTKPTNPIQK